MAKRKKSSSKSASKENKDSQNKSLDSLPENTPELPDGSLEKRIGALLRQYRNRSQLTLSDMAKGSGISTAMLSRIETGQASASLDVLTRYASALGVPLSVLFKQIEMPKGNAQFVKKNEGMEVVRTGTEQAGYIYKMLSYNFGPEKLFDSYLVEMDESSRSFASFQHKGTEFLYLVSGKVEYRYGEDLYLLEQGDSLTFSAEVEHGPERLLSKSIKLLSVMIYDKDDT